MNINLNSYELNIYLIYWLTLWYRSRANVSCWLGLKLKWRAESTLKKFLCYQRGRTNSFSFLFFEMLAIPINCSLSHNSPFSVSVHLVVYFGCLFPDVHCFLFPLVFRHCHGSQPTPLGVNAGNQCTRIPKSTLLQYVMPPPFLIPFASFDPRDCRRLTAHYLQYRSSPAITSFFYALLPISTSSSENLHCDRLTPL